MAEVVAGLTCVVAMYKDDYLHYKSCGDYYVLFSCDSDKHACLLGHGQMLHAWTVHVSVIVKFQDIMADWAQTRCIHVQLGTCLFYHEEEHCKTGQTQ